MHVLFLRGASAAMLAAACVGAAAAPRAHLALKSGSQQSARAWATPGTKLYETKFDTALVVAVAPPDAKVRFSCATAGCLFPPQEQGEGIERAGPSAFDVEAQNGTASIKLIVRTPSVAPIDVVATVRGAARSERVTFVLNAR